MTGLDLRTDALIEIAALVTDSDLNVLGDGVDVVIHADDEALAAMPEVVRVMHERSGLTEQVRASTVTHGTGREDGPGLHPRVRSRPEDGATGRQLHRHRPRVHQPRHARRWTPTCTTG